MQPVVQRFFKYISINTQSDESSQTCPSTPGQLELAKVIVKELEQLGLQEICLDQNGYIMATLPANTTAPIPVIGFIAHMDTSPDMSGKNVNPQIVHQYDGKTIQLNSSQNIDLNPEDFPELLEYLGQDLITTDGTTLLGADNKAGITIIMTLLETLQQNPEIPHGTLKIGFTPDEEIGRGADRFDVKKFAADFAYTIDGGPIGELEYENFNAAKAKLTIKGRNIHPGYAKNKMINASLIAMELESLLPQKEKPEYTEKYEGFFHLIHIQGDVEEAELEYIIRDHDRQKFEERKSILKNSVSQINNKYKKDLVTLHIEDSYYNMKEKIEPVKFIVDTARKAIEMAGVKPVVKPIRGGTDGAKLSYMGLPCPNLFTGGHNFHGKYEFIPVQSMEKAVEVLLKLIECFNSSKP